MKTRILLSSSIVALAALALSACGGSDGGSSPATVPADTDLVVDAGPGLKFGSTEYDATAGAATVVLVNKDTQRHTMVIVAADGKTLPGELEVFKSGEIDEKDYDLAAGTYSLLCLVPGHEDMKATLTVK